MRRFLFFLLTFFACLSAEAQEESPNIVNLTVVGEGDTKSSALTNALKTATTQAFGAFVSTNTTIIDDELVKDELVSVSSGNIISYQELGEVKLDNGNIELTVNVTVSVNNLTAFAKTKGSSCELSGNVLVQQVRLNKLNKKNAEKVIDNLCKQIEIMAPYCYSPKLEKVRLIAKIKEYDECIDCGDKERETYYKLKADIILEPNQEYINNVYSIICSTLESIEPSNYSGIDVSDVYVDVKNCPVPSSFRKEREVRGNRKFIYVEEHDFYSSTRSIYKSYIDGEKVTEKLIKAFSNMYYPYVIKLNFSGSEAKKFLLLVHEVTPYNDYIRYIPCLRINYYNEHGEHKNIVIQNYSLHVKDYWILEESEVENFTGVTIERVQSVENDPFIHVESYAGYSDDSLRDNYYKSLEEDAEEER